MEIKGKLIQKLQLQSGVSKAGNNWQKQEFVIETLDQYPQQVCIQLFGDKVDMLASYNINDTLVVSFDLMSREYNGRWYTDVRAWKIAMETAQAPQTAPAADTLPTAQPTAAATPEVTTFNDIPAEGGADDLPF